MMKSAAAAPIRACQSFSTVFVTYAYKPGRVARAARFVYNRPRGAWLAWFLDIDRCEAGRVTENVTPRVKLADAIAELRSEISRARAEGRGKDVRFAAKAIEVELSLEFGQTAEGAAGVPKWVPLVECPSSDDYGQIGRLRI